MPEVSPNRITAIAEAARVPIETASAERIAGAVSFAVNRLAAANLAIPLEVEPSSFVAIQLREIDR
jgi:hypothetical protein